jgi:large subunit ribosomal protein L15
MPLKQRLPKFGFTSRVSQVTAEVRLSELAKVEGDVISLDTLKAANLVTKDIKFVKVILSGEIARSVTVKGIRVTKGAKAAIEAAGGKIEE